MPNPAVGSASSEPDPPGMNVAYNHDLNPSEDFLACFPAIRDALFNPHLWKEFDIYDKRAKAHKKAFHRLGLCALILGSLPILMAAVRTMLGESRFGEVWGLGVVMEFAGLAAVVMLLWSRLKQHRKRWAQALFCRERLRHWHFQTFLDGQLISLLPVRKNEYDLELKRRWDQLGAKLLDGYGLMMAFAHAAPGTADIFHKPTNYTDSIVVQQVFDALWILRFEHQVSYSQRKTEVAGELEERTIWSETLARLTLAGAVVVSALACLVSLAHLVPFGWHPPWEPLSATRVLGGLALLLAVLSAASRAFRTGFTLPGESESYEEYCDRVRELQAAFKAATSAKDKLQYLAKLEEEAAAELRRFLRMKLRATFVF